MSINSFSLPEARLLSVFLESIFYGVYIVILGFTVKCFTQKKHYWTHPMHYILACATAILAGFVTLDVVIGYRQVWIAFITSPSKEDGLAYLSNPKNMDNLIRIAVTPILALIADGMLMYRVFVIYERRFIFLLGPLIFWFANLVVSVVAIIITALSGSYDMFNLPASKPFVISAVVTNACGTLLSTGLIAYFFYHAAKETALPDSTIIFSKQPGLSVVVRVVVESGLMITTANILLLITYLVSSNADYPISDVLNVFYAIGFNLIIIRIDDRCITSGLKSPSDVWRELRDDHWRV